MQNGLVYCDRPLFLRNQIRPHFGRLLFSIFRFCRSLIFVLFYSQRKRNRECLRSTDSIWELEVKRCLCYSQTVVSNWWNANCWFSVFWRRRALRILYISVVLPYLFIAFVFCENKKVFPFKVELKFFFFLLLLCGEYFIEVLTLLTKCNFSFPIDKNVGGFSPKHYRVRGRP